MFSWWDGPRKPSPAGALEPWTSSCSQCGNVLSNRKFPAYALPSWAQAPSHLRSAPSGPGLEIHCPDLDPAWMAELSAGLRELPYSGEGPAAITRGDADPHLRARSLGAVGCRFLDPEDELRREALALLPRPPVSPDRWSRPCSTAWRRTGCPSGWPGS